MNQGRIGCLISVAALSIAGCCEKPHCGKPSGFAQATVKTLSGTVEQVVLVPSTASNPTTIETEGLALKARVQFSRTITVNGVPKQTDVCYEAFIDANSRVHFEADGRFTIDSGAIYVASCEPKQRVMKMLSLSTKPAEADDWVWVSTSRVDAGAEGSAIAVRVDSDGYHRVFFVGGTYAFVSVNGGEPYRWHDTTKYQEINLFHTRTEKPVSANPAVESGINDLTARAAAAGVPVP